MNIKNSSALVKLALPPLILLLGCFFVQSVVLPNIAKLFL